MTANKRQRGSSLIVVLVITFIFAVIAAAMATLIMGHTNRASVDKNSAQALDAAECALNYQVQRIFANMQLGDAQVVYNGSNINTATFGLVSAPIPVTGKDATLSSTATILNTRLNLNTGGSPADFCVCWVEYPGQPTRALTTSTEDAYFIYGQARVNGVTRTVRAKASSIDIFKRWAMFGNTSISVGGSFSVTPTSSSPGPNGELGIVGSNGTIDIDKNTAAVGGQAIYGNGAPDPDFPYTEGGKKIDLPPINELAEAAYREGTSLASGVYPSSNNGNGIGKFSANNDNQGKALVTRNNGNTTALPTNGNFPNQYSWPLKLSSTAGRATNFYLNRIDGSGVIIWADVSNGPINIWVNNTGSGNNANDQIQGNIDIAAYKTLDGSGNPIRLLDNSPLLHIYYSNPNGGLRVTGGGSTQSIYGMFYFYNTTSDGTPFGSFSTGGTVTINGAVIGDTLGRASGGGNFTVNYPSTVGAGGNTEGALFGLNTPWTEYNPLVGN